MHTPSVSSYSLERMSGELDVEITFVKAPGSLPPSALFVLKQARFFRA